MKELLSTIACVALVLTSLSCTEESDPDAERATFSKVYDHSEYRSAFRPLDVVQTPDNGYLILAERALTESAYSGIYLLKVSETGAFVAESVSDETYVNPVGDLMVQGDRYAFIAMDVANQQSVIITTDASIESLEYVSVPGSSYPAAATADGEGFLLLSYNHVDRTSVLSRRDFNGAVTRGPVAFSIGAGDEAEEPVMDHFTRTGRRFPFQTGRTADGQYYFNGFIDYTFSLVFTDLSGDGPAGVVHGQHDNGGFSSVLPLGGNRYAAARFNFGANYILPGIELTGTGISSVADLGGHTFPELTPDAPVQIRRITVDNEDFLVFASNTLSKQIGLYFYRESDGSFSSSKYLGFSNPFEIGAFIQTDDEGILVCGTTWLAGRFPRVCLFKISADEVRQHIRP